MPKRDTIAAVDVGTSSINCLIGDYDEDYGIEILGKGQAPSHGVKRGAIDDIEECAKSIELAIIEAENSAGVRVNQVVAGISGEYISSGSSRSRIKIAAKGTEITKADIHQVLESINDKKDEDFRILHAIPRSFTVDGQVGVRNPLGMLGKNLEVDAYLIAAEEVFLQNINRAFQRSGLELEHNGYVFSSYAAARAVVDDSEKKLGVAFVDIGAGTTKVAIYKEGVLIHSRTIPLGGDNITYDIAMFYKIPLSEAENKKVTEGLACPELLTEEEKDQEVEAISFSESQSSVMIPRKVLSEIIEARLMDIFEAVNRDIRRLGNKGIYIAGAIITGGAARLKHINFLAQRVLDLPVKIGRPGNIAGLGNWEGNPEFSGVVGVLQMASEKRTTGSRTGSRKSEMVSIFKKAVNWLHEVF